MTPGATLLMSGFYEEDVPLIRAEGERLGLTFVHQKSDKRWTLVKMAK